MACSHTNHVEQDPANGNVTCGDCREVIDNIWFRLPGLGLWAKEDYSLVMIKCPGCWKPLAVYTQFLKTLAERARVATPCCERVSGKVIAERARAIVDSLRRALTSGRRVHVVSGVFAGSEAAIRAYARLNRLGDPPGHAEQLPD